MTSTAEFHLEILVKAIWDDDSETFDACLQRTSSLTLGGQPLSLACARLKLNMVKALLYQGADPNSPSRHTLTCPLHLACTHETGNLGIVKMLIDASASVNAQDFDGVTPLHLACTNENIEVVKLLLENKASIHLMDVDDETALVRACYCGSVELIKLLVKAGSDVNVSQGLPIHTLVISGNIYGRQLEGPLKVLLDAGADVTGRGYLGRAANLGDMDKMLILKEAGVEVLAVDCSGLSALNLACYNQNSDIEIIHQLLKWGDDINSKGLADKTPLFTAVEQMCLPRVKLLLSYGGILGDDRTSFPYPTAYNHSYELSRKKKKTFMTILRLLIASGNKVSENEVKKLKHMLSTWHPDIPIYQEQVIRELELSLTGPPSLLDICRVIIRNSVPTPKDKNMKYLNLPEIVTKRLSFSDILE